MKKIAMMIAALVMTLSANAQFEQGKMYVGASMTGFDASYSGATEFHLGIDAKAGYFFMDNLLALGQVGYKHNGYEGASDEFNIGVGGDGGARTHRNAHRLHAWQHFWHSWLYPTHRRHR